MLNEIKGWRKMIKWVEERDFREEYRKQVIRDLLLGKLPNEVKCRIIAQV